MKKHSNYKKFKLYEVTAKDAKEDDRYTLGDILIFLPEDEQPMLRYEDWQTKMLESQGQAKSQYSDSSKNY